MTRKTYGTTKDAVEKRMSPFLLFLIVGALILIIVGAFALFRGAASRAKAIEASGQPKLSVDREKIDFGKVPLNKPVLAEFELSNVGDQPLTLAGVPTVEVREGC